jgi:type IV secretory pathway TrbD component
MIATVLHDIFAVVKFFFGLGALFGLIGIAGLFLWFLGRIIMRWLLRGQPARRYPTLRKMFLES